MYNEYNGYNECSLHQTICAYVLCYFSIYLGVPSPKLNILHITVTSISYISLWILTIVIISIFTGTLCDSRVMEHYLM